MKRSITAAFAMLLGATPALALDWVTPHAYYGFDIHSCYISRGKLFEDRPIQANEVDISLDFGNFGRLGFNHWDYSCLSDKYQDKYRRFMPETDWSLYYEYDLKIAEGWELTTRIEPEWETYYGGKPEDDPSAMNWRFKQTLATPYVTPYWKIHFCNKPDKWWYYQLGLKRKFDITEKFSLRPCVMLDLADGRGRVKRFGRRADGSGYGAGVVSLAAELTAEYAFTSWFSVHASVGQFGVIDSAGRDNLEESHQRDITYAQVGFTLGF